MRSEEQHRELLRQERETMARSFIDVWTFLLGVPPSVVAMRISMEYDDGDVLDLHCAELVKIPIKAKKRPRKKAK